MEDKQLINIVKKIVAQAKDLKDRYTSEVSAPVNYACVFAHSEKEYKELSQAAQLLGPVVKETESGFLHHVNIETSGGLLRILKIRRPDPTKIERGGCRFYSI